MPYTKSEYVVGQDTFAAETFTVSGFRDRWTAYPNSIGSFMGDLLYANNFVDIKIACINYQLGRLDSALISEKEPEDLELLRQARAAIMEQLEKEHELLVGS